jgi:hypothetical protein
MRLTYTYPRHFPIAIVLQMVGHSEKTAKGKPLQRRTLRIASRQVDGKRVIVQCGGWVPSGSSMRKLAPKGLRGPEHLLLAPSASPHNRRCCCSPDHTATNPPGGTPRSSAAAGTAG